MVMSCEPCGSVAIARLLVALIPPVVLPTMMGLEREPEPEVKTSLYFIGLRRKPLAMDRCCCFLAIPNLLPNFRPLPATATAAAPLAASLEPL